MGGLIGEVLVKDRQGSASLMKYCDLVYCVGEDDECCSPESQC